MQIAGQIIIIIIVIVIVTVIIIGGITAKLREYINTYALVNVGTCTGYGCPSPSNSS